MPDANYWATPSSRRVKLLGVSLELLTDLFRLDGRVCLRITGLPKDARIVRVSDQLWADRDLLAFQVESAEFPEVQPGHHIPDIKLNVEELWRAPLVLSEQGQVL